MRVERIVVGVDGSANSLAAVEWAAGMASLVAAEVIAVHAMGLLESLGSGDPVPSFPHRGEIQEAFEATWCQPLRAAGVRYQCQLRDGSAVPVLLAVSDEVGADLIVVGSRGLGGYPELLLGSTSTQVAQNAHTPVTIVSGPLPAD
jgi:nucleotide-binding universal stress UspA family protein